MARSPSVSATVAILLMVLAPLPARALGLADAKVLLHLAATTTSQLCTRPQANPACVSAVTAGGLYPDLYFAYILVADGSPVDGIAGLGLGIDYDSGSSDGVGVDVFAWTICATLELIAPTPVWPNPHSSALITWDTTTRCQRNEPGGPGTGVVATAGYFYCASYSDATLRIQPYNRPSQPAFHNKVTVSNCIGGQATIYDAASPPPQSPLGSVHFSESGTLPGYNPCAAVIPVEPTTWSRIKVNSD